jgi:hypothetical protein
MGTIIGILVLVAIPAIWYLQTPPEPPENIEARERYGKVGREEMERASLGVKIRDLRATGLTDSQVASRLRIPQDKVSEFL